VVVEESCSAFNIEHFQALSGLSPRGDVRRLAARPLFLEAILPLGLHG
jgi:hypothetical protein